jgi:hypothetical protein
MPTMRTTPPQRPEPHPLAYRGPNVNAVPPPAVGPREWLKVSVALGVLSWGSVALVCAGGTSRLALLPVALAAGGLTTGIMAATNALPRDATPTVFGAIFLSFSILAIWLIALVLL